MAEPTEVKETKEEVVEGAGTDAETAAAEEQATSPEKPEEQTTEPEEKPKKFTDEDMKKARESYQRETRAERDARIAAETELRVLKELGAGKKDAKEEVAPSTPVTRPVRPIEADFETRELFNAAMDKYEDDRDAWRDAERTKQQQAHAAEASKTEAQKALERTITEQVNKGRETYKDFDEVVVNNPSLATTPTMILAISKRANSHEVAYYLGKNPAEALRIAQLTDPVDIAAEIGAISASIKSSSAAKPAASQPAVSKAPKPAATVGGKAKVSTDTSLEGKTREERMAMLEERSRQNRLRRA